MDGRSVPQIFIDLINQLATLLRKEAELARREISEKIGQIALGLALLIAGAVLLMPAIVILLQAAVAGLADGGVVQPWAAALIVGGAALLIGLILAAVGLSRVRAESLVPRRTIHQVQRDVSVAKHQIGKDQEPRQAA